jgi:quinate dehydrogenase (quinone)
MERNLRPLSFISRAWLSLLGIVILAASLFFIIGGAKLVLLGGSKYFVTAGVGLFLSGIQIVRRKPSGAYLFALVFLGTAAWAVWDAGIGFWPLVSRLFAMAVGGIFVAISLPLLRTASGRRPAYLSAFAIALVLAAGCAVTFASMFQPHGTIAASNLPALTPVAPGAEQKNWNNYGNDAGGSRFAALDQINRTNVKDLQVAWTYRTGDTPISPGGNGAEDQQTPLQVGNRVFLCTPHNNVIALDADTGKQIWKNEINAKSSVWMRCRGLAYYDATVAPAQPTVPGSSAVLPGVVAADAPCQRRILMNSIQAKLYAIDADTGAFCPDFGNNGMVDLKAGMGDAPDPSYVLTSAPTLAGTTVVVGGRVADNVSTDMPGGVMRGFDVITGKLRWAFDPGNPDLKQMPPAGQTYTRSTPNVWAAMSYDSQTNTVVMPVGSSSVDLWGVNRTPLNHKYGASILALDATTGQEKWHYQTVHNDLWDFDVPMQPSFIDFKDKDGKTIPAVVVGTKAGQIYVLNRSTGKPLTEVQDVAVKPGTIPGEPYSPTQPRSVGMPQIGAQTLTESNMWGATPFDQLYCRIWFKEMRYDGLYTVPDTDLSLSFPGSLGGMNWGGLSTDPTNGYIFVNDMRLGLWIQMFQQQPQNAAANTGGESTNVGMGMVPLKGTPYSVKKDRFLSPLGIPCQEPPYGTMTAIDMKTQKIAWQVPLGTVQDTGPLGIRMGLQIPIGMPSLGGSLATQGGLLFFAGTQDYYLRAFNTANGDEVWKSRLPVGSQGGPMTYKSPATGKQYVLISAGGARQSPDRGDYVIAYALPDSAAK